MKVLIYGSKGWIGKQFIHLLQEQNVEFCRGFARVNEIEDLKKEISLYNPTHIIAFIGRTHGPNFNTIDYLEQPGKLVENLRDNLYAQVTLANVCTMLKIHYTCIGTGCIFEYTEDHPVGSAEGAFQEHDIPNFFGSSYSIVKGFTDMLMHQYEDSVLNLRIRLPIATMDNPRNLISKIIRYDRVSNLPNSVSVLPNLMPAVLKMMNDGVTGTINLTNPGVISHNKILELYKKHVNPEFKWKTMSIQEQDAMLAARRSNNYLDTSTLKSYYGNDLLDVEDAVEMVLKNWNKKTVQIKGTCTDEQNKIRHH